MANTPNYNLKKVEYTEMADIPGHFNANFDTIDAGMKSNADAAVAAEDNAKSFTSGLVGSLSGLLTTVKTNIVAAINEIFQDLAAHKADYTTFKTNVTNIPIVYNLPAASGFTAWVVEYQKCADRMVSFYVATEKESDFDAGQFYILGTLPYGYRPRSEIYHQTVLFTSGGTMITNAFAIIIIRGSGEVSLYTMPGGTFTNARRIRGVRINYIES